MAQQNPIAPQHTLDATFEDSHTRASAGTCDPNAEARAFAVWGATARYGEAGGSLASLSIDAAILATAAGDRARFAALFQLLAPRAKSYLINRGLPPAAAEDFAISTLIEVWRTARAFDPSQQSGQAWIFRVLRTVAHRGGVALPSVHQ